MRQGRLRRSVQGDERRPGRMPTSVGEHRQARRLRCGCPELPWCSTILWVARATSNTRFRIAAMDRMNTRPHAVSALRGSSRHGPASKDLVSPPVLVALLRGTVRHTGRRGRRAHPLGLRQCPGRAAAPGSATSCWWACSTGRPQLPRTFAHLPHVERRRTIRSADSAHTGSAIPQRRRTAHAVTTECGDPLCTAGLPGGFHAER